MTHTGPGSVNENGGDLSKRLLTGIDFIRSAASEEKLGDSWLGTLRIATSGRVISGIGLPRTSKNMQMTSLNLNVLNTLR